MAIETTLGGDGSLFIGEDKRIRFGPLSQPNNWNATLQGVYSPPDLSGKEIRFVVRIKDGSADPAIIDREIDGFLGTYNAVLASNTQQPYIDLTDAELNLFRIRSDGSNYRWSLKILDEPETVLAWGDFAPQQATAR